MHTFPYLVNVGGLLLLIFFIFAVISMNFFATVKFNGPMTENLNFQTVPNALVSLFVMRTSNNFFELTNAVGITNSLLVSCLDSPSYEDYEQAGF